MQQCPNKTKNETQCNCTYTSCSRKGACCECVTYHRAHKELPVCYFSAEAEKTYDRSIKNFLSHNSKK